MPFHACLKVRCIVPPSAHCVCCRRESSPQFTLFTLGTFHGRSCTRSKRLSVRSFTPAGLHWSLSTSSTRPCGQAHPGYDANYQPPAAGDCTGDRRFHPHQPWLQEIVMPVHCGSSTLIVLSFKIRRGCDVCVSAGLPRYNSTYLMLPKVTYLKSRNLFFPLLKKFCNSAKVVPWCLLQLYAYMKKTGCGFFGVT